MHDLSFRLHFQETSIYIVPLILHTKSKLSEIFLQNFAAFSENLNFKSARFYQVVIWKTLDSTNIARWFSDLGNLSVTLCFPPFKTHLFKISYFPYLISKKEVEYGLC